VLFVRFALIWHFVLLMLNITLLFFLRWWHLLLAICIKYPSCQYILCKNSQIKYRNHLPVLFYAQLCYEPWLALGKNRTSFDKWHRSTRNQMCIAMVPYLPEVHALYLFDNSKVQRSMFSFSWTLLTWC